MTSIPAFEYAACGDLDGYVREFEAGTHELDAVLSAGRLPFPPELAERSPELANLVTRIWRVTSTDSPAYRQLFEVDRQFLDDPLPHAASPSNIGRNPGHLYSLGRPALPAAEPVTRPDRRRPTGAGHAADLRAPVPDRWMAGGDQRCPQISGAGSAAAIRNAVWR